MTFEHVEEGCGGVVAVALSIHPAVAVVEEGEDVHGAVADILELLKAPSRFLGAQIRGEPFEDLYPGAFVEEEEVARGVPEQRQEMLHLGEEVRIRDVEEVARLVGEPVVTENAVNGRLARGGADSFRPCFEMQRGPSQ